nr:hypothetical protein [Melioribacteraceae bacterium]
YNQGDKVEAIVVANYKPTVSVKLLDNRYKELFSFKSSESLEKDTIVEVLVKQLSSGKINRVDFVKKVLS